MIRIIPSKRLFAAQVKQSTHKGSAPFHVSSTKTRGFFCLPAERGTPQIH